MSKVEKLNKNITQVEDREELIEMGDARYLQPKGPHGIPVAEIDKVIYETPIYSEAREALLNAQREQVGYGISKYPEPLSEDSWSLVEALEHDISETADGLHYKVMLKKKLTQLVKKQDNLLKGLGVGKTMCIDTPKKVVHAICTDIYWIDDLGFVYVGVTAYGNEVRMTKQEFWFKEDMI